VVLLGWTAPVAQPCDSKGLDAKGTAGWRERAAAIRGVTDEGACTRADKYVAVLATAKSTHSPPTQTAGHLRGPTEGGWRG